MTRLLEKAFAEASKLPAGEQDALADWLLHELESERRWDNAFAKSHAALEKMAREALEEDRRGETHEFDPERL